MRKRRESLAGRDPREAEEIVQNARRPDGPENITAVRRRQREAEAGSESFRSIGELAAETVADITFRHRVRRLHARGPRLIAELLDEIACDRALGTYIDSLLDRYLAIRDADLDLVGGSLRPPAPVHEVQR